MNSFQTPKRQSRTLTVPDAPKKPSKKLRESDLVVEPSMSSDAWSVLRRLDFESLYPSLIVSFGLSQNAKN